MDTARNLLTFVIPGFIGGGFFVILLAPAFKLFKKAGRRQWLALVPGANVLTFMNICGRPAVRAGFASFAVFPAAGVVYLVLMLQGEPLSALALVLAAAAVLFVSLYFFPFPLLSTSMAFTAACFLAITPAPDVIALAVTIVLIVFAALQAVWDCLGWLSFLKKLGRPAWQIVFLLVPTAVALVLAAAGLLAGPLGSTLILGTFLPSLFAGFAYFYYLGYSAKVRFRTE